MSMNYGCSNRWTASTSATVRFGSPCLPLLEPPAPFFCGRAPTRPFPDCSTLSFLTYLPLVRASGQERKFVEVSPLWNS